MTNLEHLIENTFVRFENCDDADSILKAISEDPNLEDVRIPVYTVYEICQYVWCTYLDYGNRLKTEDLSDFPAFPVPENRELTKPALHEDGTSTLETLHFIDYHCPWCNTVVGEHFGSEPPRNKDKIKWKNKFCSNCGQAINWSDEK